VIETENKKDQLEEGYKLDPAGEIVPDYDTTIKYFSEGDLLKGVVVQIDRYEVLVDVGYKSEGIIPLNELSVKSNVNPEDLLDKGQEIVTVVVQKEDSEGRLILSKKKADFETAWENIINSNKENKNVCGEVIEVVRGGLILNVGVRGFLPASLIDRNRVKSLEEYLHQELECKIIEVNRSRNNVVLSRKAVLNNEERSEKHKILDKLTRGQVIKGKVSSIVDFGAFIDLGGVDGLIHISEISWEHVNHPSEILSVGQDVEVQILDIDQKKGRISLGLKQTQEDPWKNKLEDYEIGQIINGKVIKVLPFGVFVEFGDGLEGLIHISELAPGRVVSAKEVVEVGVEVETKLIGIDLSRRRISLSIKQLTHPEASDDKEEKEEKVEAKEPEVTEEKAEVETAEESSSAEATEDKEVEEKVEEKAEAEATVETEEVAEVETVEEKVEEKVEAKVEEKAKEQTPEETVEEKVEEKAEEVKAEEPQKEEEKAEEEKPLTTEDEALLEKLAQGPTKIEDKAVEDVPEANSLEDVLEQMKKSHGAKKK